MATEETRLLKKPFDYLSNASLTVNVKARDCLIAIPGAYEKNNNGDDIDA